MKTRKPKLVIVAALAGAALILVALWLPGTRRPEKQDAPSTEPADSAAPTTPPSAASASPAPSLDPATVPASVRPILGLANETESVRWQAVQALGRDLNQAEREGLYGYLRGHETASNEQMRGVLKNNVILALKNQIQPPPELTRVLLQIFRDPDQDSVIRNYALQHLATWYDQSAAEADIRQALWVALDETDGSLAGTALLGLHRLAQTHQAPDPDRIGATALRLAQDPNSAEPLRLAALQVCAERGIQDALPVALELAEATQSTPLRISALAAIGSLGGPAQTAWLERMSPGASPHLLPALHRALKQLKERERTEG